MRHNDNIGIVSLYRYYPDAVHSSKTFTRTYTMGKQGVVPIKDVRHSVFLMLHELDFRRHAHKANMAPVILTRADTVE